jgi:hypothetical protein
MQRYLILIEPTATGYSAHSPDVPGCVATAPSLAELEQVMREAHRVSSRRTAGKRTAGADAEYISVRVIHSATGRAT